VRLANGLTLLVRRNASAPVVVLEGMLHAGAVLDPPGKTGLASFTAGLLTRGSEHYNYDEFNTAIESAGANLSISADTEGASVGLTCLAEDFPALVEVLADALRRPAFAPAQVDLLRRQRLVYLQERDQEPDAVANIRFYDTLYGGHAYGKPASGYVNTVATFSRADAAAFHAAHYSPDGAVIAVSGDVDADAVVALVERTLGDWRGAAPLPLPAWASPGRNSHRVDLPMPGKVQSEVVVGALAVGRNSPDYYAVRVANTVLGVFGMMGRLGEVVREQQGLAYYAYSTQDAGRDTGVWLASAGVNPEDAEQCLASVEAEFARLYNEPVEEAELEDSKAYLCGVVPLTLETNDGIASTLLNIEWYGLELDYLHHYPQQIAAVTAADVQRVARAYLRPDACVTVVAGPPL
jgi:zinc protease